MSTGVFRQYPAPRIAPPRFTPGQPLGTPIASLQVVGAAQRPRGLTWTSPLGIAHLLAVVAAVPPAMVVTPARSAYQFQQPVPELIGALLSQVGPSSPGPGVEVESTPRAVYTQVQPQAPGVAALMAVDNQVLPTQISMPLRALPIASQPLPEPIAPFLTQVGPSAPLPTTPIDWTMRAPYPLQMPCMGIAALAPATAEFVFGMPMVRTDARTQTTLQLQQPGVAALMNGPAPIQGEVRVTRYDTRQAALTQQPGCAIAAVAPATVETIPASQVLLSTRAPYPLQLLKTTALVPPSIQLYVPRGSGPAHTVYLRAPWLSRLSNVCMPQIGVVPPVEITGSTDYLIARFNGRVLTAGAFNGHLLARRSAADMRAENTDETLQVRFTNRTVH